MALTEVAAPPVEIREVDTRAAREAFVRLSWRLNRDRPLWVPPLLSDERRFLDPGHPARSYCDATFVLATRGREIVGRIAGIVNRRYNDKVGSRTARFGLIECVDDLETMRALLDHVEAWARSRGLDRVVGPMGYTDQDAEGLLIDGFEYPPTIATYYNPEYTAGLLTACGYGKEVGYVVYRLDVPAELPPLYRRILDRSSARGAFRLVEFTKKPELKPYIEPVLGLMGESYEGIYGFVAPTPDERRELARQYLPLLDPRFVKVVEKDGDVVGFVIGMPNLAPGLRAANGRLFPFGFLPVLRAMKASRQLDLLLGGVRADCRGRGVDGILGAAMIREAQRGGYTLIDSHHELEENRPMRAEFERMGGVVYKRYQVFGKSLADAGARAPAR
ncbi:MAG: N-acetyltransferase family protein [Hyphomicrobiales bacterium]